MTAKSCTAILESAAFSFYNKKACSLKMSDFDGVEAVYKTIAQA